MGRRLLPNNNLHLVTGNASRFPLFLNLFHRYGPRYIDEGIGERYFMDGMTELLIFSISAFAAAFSALPIGLCCYLFKRQTDQ